MNTLQRYPRPVTVAGGFYEALRSGDHERARRLLHDDVVLHVPGGHPLAGDHRGPGAVLQFGIDSRALTEDGEHIEVIDLLGGGEHAAAYCRITAARAGRRPLANTTVHMMRIRSGQIAEAWLHNWDGKAVNDFWS